eukprot:1886133-Rhodomonas_salina.1
MSGTEIANGTICLPAGYTMPGTETAYSTISPGTDLAYRRGGAEGEEREERGRERESVAARSEGACGGARRRVGPLLSAYARAMRCPRLR